MPQPTHLDPSAYAADGGPVGALLIHGFTGSAAETRPMGQYLAERGLTVRCPSLPGHGTTPEDLTHIRWQAWTDAAESSLGELQGLCESVFVCGFSLGALIALWLGVEHPEIIGLIAMAPPLRTRSSLMPLTLALRRVRRYIPPGAAGDDDLGDPEAVQRIWCYDELPLWGAGEVYLIQRHVRAALHRIHQPILIFQGRNDTYLRPEAARILHDRAASADKTLVWLENSGHNLLADGERESVWARGYAWIMERAVQQQG